MRLILLWLTSMVPALALAQSATTPGTPSSPHPTLENLSVVWPITGDDDLDGVVTVRYRAMGSASYREGLPLRRVPAGAGEGFTWANVHSGSVFDLVPGTTYEIELALEDPDGGSITQTITATTRPEPAVPAGARIVDVTVASFAAALAAAEPNDVLVLAPGTYAGFTVESDGEPDRPIVIRSGTPGMAVVDGEIRLDDRSHVWLEDLSVRDRIVLHTSHAIVVRGCSITTPDDGVVAFRGGTSDSYVCDNVVLGPTTTWEDAALGADGANLGEGIQLAGPGNVICYNRLRGFRDAISTMEDDEATEQYSIDIVGNDIELGADDAIEADFTMGNVRVMRNRIRNSFVGISGQPTLGGPAYFVRNVMFNVVYSPFKLHRGSVGDVALHNTVVKCGDAFAVYAGRAWSQAYFRNNLFLGGEGGGTYGGYGNGDGQVAVLADADATCDFDYDGYGSIGTGRFEGRIGAARFTSLAELASRTTEVHAVELDLGVFAADVTFPSTGPFPERETVDLRLRSGSAAVDRGQVLANVNDGFGGAAPDLGAYELGSELPHYGPRTGGVAPVCGNGAREGAEECDDGNAQDGDGCSAGCTLESLPGIDGGPSASDAGARTDGGTEPAMGGGCGCSVPGTTRSSSLALLIVIAMMLHRRR